MADNYGLRLNRHGASGYAAVLVDDEKGAYSPIPGVFHSDPKLATPVGDNHPISIEDARRYDKAKDIPLELVTLSARAANQSEKALAEELNVDAPDGATGTKEG